jgi:hypothetical protein
MSEKSELVKIKTNELKEKTLDWAVAKCIGEIWEGDWYARHTCRFKSSLFGVCLQDGTTFNPSTRWEHGGPIIDSELLAPEPLLDTNGALIEWQCHNWKGDGSDFYGPTSLIAAMRCYVASELGNEVEIPRKLLPKPEPQALIRAKDLSNNAERLAQSETDVDDRAHRPSGGSA